MKRQAKALSAVALSLFALLLLAAVPAQATKSVVDVLGAAPTGEGGTRCQASDPNNCFARPQGIAINQTTGDLYVADYANQRVVRLDENGEFERAWGWDVDADDPGTGFEICVAPANCKNGVGGDGTGQLDIPTGIAVDQSTGDVYVLGRGMDEKFDLDGNLIRSFELGELSPLVVKPVSNSLLVGGGSISWRDSSGNPLATFGFGMPYAGADFLGVDSTGAIYVGPTQNYQGEYTVLKLTAGGVSLGAFGGEELEPGYKAPSGPEVLPGHFPTAVGVDSVNDSVYVARFARPVFNSTLGMLAGVPHQLAEFDTSGQLIDVHATGMPYRVNGLAVNSSTGRIYMTVGASLAGGPGQDGYYPAVDSHVLVLDEATNPPVPSITSIASVTASGATLTGTVNPQGTTFDTGYHWEYRKQGTQDWAVTPAADVDVGNGTDPEPAGPEAISGLEPNTTYEVRLVATREGGAGFGVDADSFKTQAPPAKVTERSAYPVGDVTAQLRAVINPNNSATEYHFEYGTDESYGSKTPVHKAVPAYEEVPVYITAKGLQTETTYHYRVVVDNGVGDPVEGPDLSFTTRSSVEMVWPERGVELASAPDTGAQNAIGRISRDSDHVFWATTAGAPGSPTGSLGAFVAERTLSTPTGWQSRSLLPSIDQLIGGGQTTYVGVAASPDARSVVFQAPFGPSIYWVRTNPDGSQTELAVTEASDVGGGALPQASADLRHVLILDKTPLAGSAHPKGSFQIYDVGSGSPRLVSRLGDGKGPACGVPNSFTGTVGSGFGESAYEGYSRDTGPGVPLRVFFETTLSTCPGGTDEGVRRLYVNDDGGTATPSDDQTTLISGPPVSGPQEKAYFLRANPAGDQAIFATATSLAAEDTDATEDLYKWTLGEGNRCLTCAFDAAGDVRYGSGLRQVIVASDLNSVYFRSPNQLIAGEGIPGSADNLWLLRDEDGGVELDYVGQGGSDPRTSEASEDGEILVFQTAATGVTPDRTGGFAQFYRYDSTDGSIECISCPPPGVPARPVEGAPLSGNLSILAIAGLAPTRILSADGSTLAFTSSVAYVPEDINGGQDVYEWHRDGRLRLVSDGETRFPTGPGAPALSGISADGRNILFTAAAKLTGWEIAATRQAFVARVGGGLPPPGPPAEPCLEDACQGALTPAPQPRNFGSQNVNRDGNVLSETSRPRVRCKASQARRGNRCVAKRKAAGKACKKGAGKATKRVGKAKKRACPKTSGRSAK